VYHHNKFRGDWSNRCWNMLSKWRSSAILDF